MNESSTALAVQDVQNPQLVEARFREATNIAAVCKELVMKTAKRIGNRQYVPVEGWTSIAVAHGCIAQVRDGSVQEVLREGKVVGIRAYAELIRQSDGKSISGAEGYVGADEPLWFGGEDVVYEDGHERVVTRRKRADYAIRAMSQTRSISRVCRTAFMHVVILMKENLETTPAEEISDPDDRDPLGERRKADAAKKAESVEQAEPSSKPIEVPREEIVALQKQFEEGKWEKVKIHFGTNKGKALGELEIKSLLWYCFGWKGGGNDKYGPTPDDKILRTACNVAIAERGLTAPKDERS